MEEIEELLKENPEASARYAIAELHQGRIEWLAEHIKRCNLRISPEVARKILSLIEPNGGECIFELKLVRRSDIPPAKKDPLLVRVRDFEMAIEVARRGGFERAQSKRVCHEVGELPAYGLSGEVVAKRVRPYRDQAIAVICEERTTQEYLDGNVDFLGRPISPDSDFAEDLKCP